MFHCTGILALMVALSLELSETVLYILGKPLFFNTPEEN